MSEIKTNKISPRKGTTQTIGDSGDTVTIPSGVTLSNAGTISGLQKIDWDTTKKTSAFTAVNGVGYFIDTTSAAITVTFPASPSAGDVIGIKDYANTFDTNNLTINPNGNKIQGNTNNFVVSVEGTAANFIYVDSTRGWVLTDASKASDIAESPSFITATGGTETTCGDYKIHTFTGPGTFTVTQIGNAPTIPTGGPNTIDYMVVAGGAGGGNFGGGGGSGGWRASDGTNSGCYSAGPAPLVGCVSGVTASITAYPITVGAGGGGGGTPTGCGNRGANGSNSIFSTITSAGGGGGGGTFAPSNTGGSGGGGGFPVCGSNGNTPPVSPPQGNNGGNAAAGDPYSRAGGGGSGGTGGSAGPNNVAGNGANGVASSISASPVTYAGGGGGGSRPSGYPATAGSGGTGGGGAGGQGTDGTNGTANTGGGGGGGGQETPSFACQTGGSGGSGIVIIRYKYQ